MADLRTNPKLRRFVSRKHRENSVQIPDELSRGRNRGWNMPNPDPSGQKFYNKEARMVDRLIGRGTRLEQMPEPVEDLSDLTKSDGLLYER